MIYSVNPPTIVEMQRMLETFRALELTLDPSETPERLLRSVAVAKKLLIEAIICPEYQT